MKYKDITELTTKELHDLLDEEKISLVKLKIAHTVSPLDNPQKIKLSRKTIARIRTELRKRELNSNKQPEVK
jgi:large subunit ribosomal protein L29